MPQFITTAYEELKKSDQVLINLPQFEGVFVAILAKIMRKKVHCIYVCEVTLQKGFLAQIIESLLRFSNRVSLQLADTVITLTDDFAKHNKTLAAVHKKILGIYPVIPQPTVNKITQEMLFQKLTGQKKRYVIGFLGRIAAEKGIQYLLDAIPFLQNELQEDFVIALAGPTQTVGEAAYQQRIQRLLAQYHDHVVQLGELSDDDLGAFYATLDVFVLPSINQTEAFGMVQVEAMFCGTPAVVSDLPGVRVPVTKTGMGEIVPLKNAQAIADALKKVLLHKQTYQKNKSIIEEEFSDKKILTAYKALLGS